MRVRAVLKQLPPARALYDLSSDAGPQRIRGTVAPGRDLHNLRFLTQNMSAKDKLACTLDLIKESRDDMRELLELEAERPDRVKLCDIRAHEHLTGMNWVNMEPYNQELTARGMFAAAASDILRYEVVYNFGGVYLDVDIEMIGPLGDLEVDPEGALAAITPDRKGIKCMPNWKGRDAIARTGAYDERCLYLSNCIVAACPRSPLIDAMRQTIALSYKLVGWRCPKETFELDHGHDIEAYWRANITRSTLDLTGPNLVRDILWLRQSGFSWDAMPRECVGRLVRMLSGAQGLLDNSLKDTGKPHCRTDYVWRDDLPAHHEFWQWVAENAVFDMTHIDCDTEAAKLSDCRAASHQRNPKAAEEKKDDDAPFLVNFPKVAKGEILKGLVSTLHEQHRQANPLPSDLQQDQVFRWGSVQWKVINIQGPGAKRKIELERC